MKTTMSTSHLLEWILSKRKNKHWKEYGKKVTLLCSWWECIFVQPLWQIVWRAIITYRLHKPLSHHHQVFFWLVSYIWYLCLSFTFFLLCLKSYPPRSTLGYFHLILIFARLTFSKGLLRPFYLILQAATEPSLQHSHVPLSSATFCFYCICYLVTCNMLYIFIMFIVIGLSL